MVHFEVSSLYMSVAKSGDASRNRHADLHARTEGPNRAHHAKQNAQTPSRGHPGLLRPPHTSMALPKPSTAASNTYAATPRDFRNLTHYITRALLETEGFNPQLHPQLRRAGKLSSVAANADGECKMNRFTCNGKC